jgi:hypothetical protein
VKLELGKLVLGARLLLGQVITLVFAFGALLWLWSAIVALIDFSMRYPAWDQFRTYVFYLNQPFPGNLLQEQNGHHTVLPNLVRLAEIRWFSANQMVQLIVGGTAALLAMMLVAVTALREKSASIVTRAALCLLAVIAFFWLGNARMLFHGSEMLHVYFVLLFCTIAILALNHSRQRRPIFWMCIAGVSCMAATFSFGTGIASFGAVLLLGLILRISWRHLAIPASLMAATLWAYVLGMPGGDSVRGVLDLDLTADSATLLRWLSAPIVTAWLGYAPPDGLLAPVWKIVSQVGETIAANLIWIPSTLGSDAMLRASLLVGIVGMSGYIAILFHALRHRTSLPNARVLGLGLSSFVLGAGITICLARITLFNSVPNQIFADRYLPWSCIFWLGLALYAAADSMRHYWHTPPIVVGVGIVWLLFSPTHSPGWMAIVHRNNQQSAVAAQLGIWDPSCFPDNDAASREHVLTTLTAFRQRHLSMFAEPAFYLLERGWHAPEKTPSATPGAAARVTREFDDTLGQRRAFAFEGWMPPIDDLADGTVLVVVDADGKVRGLAKFGFLGPDDKRPDYTLAHQNGFDGYVLDSHPGEQLKVLALNAAFDGIIAAAALDIPAGAPSRPGEFH